jgi:hypothetical protein
MEIPHKAAHVETSKVRLGFLHRISELQSDFQTIVSL